MSCAWMMDEAFLCACEWTSHAGYIRHASTCLIDIIQKFATEELLYQPRLASRDELRFRRVLDI